MIERESLRNALRVVVSTTVSPSLVLRPYSLANPLFRYGIKTLTSHLGIRIREASSIYGSLRNYLNPRIAFYVALKSAARGIGNYVVETVQETWRAVDRPPLDALAVISARFGALRIIDRDLTMQLVDEALTELMSRHGSLVGVRIVVNNAVVKPEDLAGGVDDYADVTVVTGEENIIVKAWVAKELLRVMASVKDLKTPHQRSYWFGEERGGA